MSMKIRDTKEVRLPAFSLDSGEVKLLIGNMRKQFPSDDKGLRSVITMRVGTKTFESEDFEDIFAQGIRGSVKTFSIRICNDACSIAIRTGGLFNNVTTLSVTGETDYWMAGSVQAVLGVIKDCTVWYSWLLRLPLTLIYALICFFPIIINKFPYLPTASPPLITVWALVAMYATYLNLNREKLFPGGEIVFSNKSGFLEKYNSQISVFLFLVASAFAIYAWLYPRVP